MPIFTWAAQQAFSVVSACDRTDNLISYLRTSHTIHSDCRAVLLHFDFYLCKPYTSLLCGEISSVKRNYNLRCYIPILFWITISYTPVLFGSHFILTTEQKLLHCAHENCRRSSKPLITEWQTIVSRSSCRIFKFLFLTFSIVSKSTLICCCICLRTVIGKVSSSLTFCKQCKNGPPLKCSKFCFNFATWLSAYKDNSSKYMYH